jgi:RHS repeat-associated protein
VLRDRDPGGTGTLSERLYVQQDANWNVTAVVNGSGAVVERYAYDPYGRFTDRSGQMAGVLAPDWSWRGSSSYGWVYLHQGGRYDGAAGLYDFRHREDSPTLGRWVSQDPLGFAAGGTNLYSYLNDGPVNRFDPDGLRPPPKDVCSRENTKKDEDREMVRYKDEKGNELIIYCHGGEYIFGVWKFSDDFKKKFKKAAEMSKFGKCAYPNGANTLRGYYYSPTNKQFSVALWFNIGLKDFNDRKEIIDKIQELCAKKDATECLKAVYEYLDKIKDKIADGTADTPGEAKCARVYIWAPFDKQKPRYGDPPVFFFPATKPKK